MPRAPIPGSDVAVNFQFTDFNGRTAVTTLDFHDAGNGVIVIIATEQPDNPGASITNAAEQLWSTVLNTFDIRNPARAVFLERYRRDGGRPDDYDMVTLKLTNEQPAWAIRIGAAGTGPWLTDPKWTPMSPNDFLELGMDPPTGSPV